MRLEDWLRLKEGRSIQGNTSLDPSMWKRWLVAAICLISCLIRIGLEPQATWSSLRPFMRALADLRHTVTFMTGTLPYGPWRWLGAVMCAAISLHIACTRAIRLTKALQG